MSGRLPSDIAKPTQEPATAAAEWHALASAIRAAAPADMLAVAARAARTVQQAEAAGRLPKGVQPLRMAVLRSFTAELLASATVAALVEHQYAARCVLGQLGNAAHEILDQRSFLYREPFDVCVVAALAEHVLPGLDDPGTAATSARRGSLATWLGQLGELARRFSGLIVVCNLAAPSGVLAARLQAQAPGSGRYAIDRANTALAKLATKHSNLVVCDTAALAGRIGADAFWSPRDMLTSLQPFSAAGLVALAREIAESIALYRAAPIKCIVLDCDNTLWGGVIGEDGLGGIALGETYPGLCFQQFQRQLADLSKIGFLLALNTKNNEADVRRVFEQHPGMVLRPEQIAAERINWQDKLTNMRELAEELNLGLDSFLFIDDSDFEINLIRQELPQVRCVQTPGEPWKLPGLLPGLRLVDRLRVTAEDRKKAEMYAHERSRKQFKAAAGDLRQYLHGLAIRLDFEPFEREKHLARAAQLTQKTNQFNLTTRRFSEAELDTLSAGGAGVFLASVSDRFGEYGRVALAIAVPEATAGVWRLEVFLMSCRVIGRGIESTFLRLVIDALRARGCRTLRAEFIPTAKNAVSRDFLPRAGFRETARSADERIAFAYEVPAGSPAIDDWITVVQPAAPQPQADGSR